MTAEVIIAEANDLFVNDEFEAALTKFNKAIELDHSQGQYFVKRSACLNKLGRNAEALSDASKAIELIPDDSTAHLRKGIAAFSLEDFATALSAFTRCNELKPSSQTKTWIRKCEAELESAPNNTQTATSTTSTVTSATVAPVTHASPAAPSTVQPAVETAPKYKHDFFQTDSTLTVSVFAKGLKKENVVINIQKQQLEVTIKLGDGKEFCLDWDLCGEIIPEQSRYDILSTKIEIKMKKATVSLWPSLEGDGQQLKQWGVVQEGAAGLSYPSSSKKAVNWDKVEVEEDKLEGDAALNNVFQQIFKNGDDDQRRAMMKSFQESGGTVLSTNWKEVGSGEVKGSPPKGLEMKQWKDLHH